MESIAQEKSRSLPKTSPFTVLMWAQLLALMKRRMQILRGSIGNQFMIFASFVIFGIVLGTVFYNSPESTDAYFSRAGAVFYTVLFLTLSAMSESPSPSLNAPSSSANTAAPSTPLLEPSPKRWSTSPSPSPPSSTVLSFTSWKWPDFIEGLPWVFWLPDRTPRLLAPLYLSFLGTFRVDCTLG
ncbi:hypothetical protein D9758_015454 [Tetrapyrgos nigripes]|uniref:ABC-2 type transporter transmembrane domain-containing protein n=1 Tax=Tetrapyrgos nigripes TaxID=182062 RepID=A0A8H5FNF2_9AGAR|nr:hypothetical protein D9758_015454 [Tetrapyrgos nigripes]